MYIMEKYWVVFDTSNRTFIGVLFSVCRSLLSKFSLATSQFNMSTKN